MVLDMNFHKDKEPVAFWKGSSYKWSRLMYI